MPGKHSFWSIKKWHCQREARETKSPWDRGGLGLRNGMGLQSTDGKVIKKKKIDYGKMPALQSSSWGSVNQHNITVPNLWQLQAAPGALTAVCSARGVRCQHRHFYTGQVLEANDNITSTASVLSYLRIWKGKRPSFFPPHKVLIALMRKTEPECTFLESTFDYLLEKMSLSLNTRDCFTPELSAQKPTYMILHCSVANFVD